MQYQATWNLELLYRPPWIFNILELEESPTLYQGAIVNLFTPEQIRLARQYVKDDPSARKISDAIFAAAALWLDRDDDTIRGLMPGADVPRTWTVNYITGCPVHGSGPEGRPSPR